MPEYLFSLARISLYLLAYLLLQPRFPAAATVLIVMAPLWAALTAWQRIPTDAEPDGRFQRSISWASVLWSAGMAVSLFSSDRRPIAEGLALIGYGGGLIFALSVLGSRVKRTDRWLFILDLGLLFGLVWLIHWLAMRWVGQQGITAGGGLPAALLAVGLAVLLSRTAHPLAPAGNRESFALLGLGVIGVAFGHLIQTFRFPFLTDFPAPLAETAWIVGFLCTAEWLRWDPVNGEMPQEWRTGDRVPWLLWSVVPFLLASAWLTEIVDPLPMGVGVALMVLAAGRQGLSFRGLRSDLRESRMAFDRMDLLQDLIDSSGGGLDLNALFDRVFEKLERTYDVEGGGVWVRDFRGEYLDPFFSRSAFTPPSLSVQPKRVRMGKEMVGRVAASGRPETGREGLIGPCLTLDGKEEPDDGQSRIAAALPLVGGGDVIGVLAFFTRRNVTLRPEELRLLLAVGRQIGLAMEFRKMGLDRSRKNREAMALFHIAQAMTSTLNLSEVLQVVLDHLTDLFGVRSTWVMLHNPDRDLLELAAIRGWEGGGLDPRRISFKPGEGVLGEVFRYGHPIVVPNIQLDRRFVYKDEAAENGIHSMIGVPLVVKGKPIGVVGLYPPDRILDGGIEKEQMDLLLIFASQAAIAIENARLYRDLAEKVGELKRLQRQLIQTEKLSAMGELVSGVAHELNNPLTGVIGYAQLLMETLSDPQQKEYLDKIFEEAMSCSDIIRNLLTFARYHKPQRVQSDINSVLDRALELKTYLIETDGIQIIRRNASGLPLCWMDAHQMQQVFFNIINNAHQALLEGQSLGLKRTLTIATQQSGGWIVIHFEDSGPGIPSEVLPRIFEPFFTTKEVGVGTGLGLSISYGIVKEHGGEIKVETEMGKGTRFSVWLPTSAQNVAANGRTEGDLHGRRILLVDPSEVILEMWAYVLRSEGATVCVAKSGALAQERLRDDERFDLLVVSIPLPDMSLDAFTDALERQGLQYGDKLLFSLSEDGEEKEPDLQQILQRLGRPSLERPFNVTEFRRAIESALTSWRTLS